MEGIFTSFFEQSPDEMILISRRDNTIAALNRSSVKRFAGVIEIGSSLAQSFSSLDVLKLEKSFKLAEAGIATSAIPLQLTDSSGSLLEFKGFLTAFMHDGLPFINITLKSNKEAKLYLKSLSKSDGVLVRLIEQLPYMHWFCDKELIIYHTQSGVFNFEPAILNKPLYEAFPGRQIHLSALHIFKDKTIHNLIKTDKKVFEASFSPLKKDAGDIVGVFGSFLDISGFNYNAAGLTTREQLLLEIYRSLSFSIAIVDAQGIVLQHTEHWQKTVKKYFLLTGEDRLSTDFIGMCEYYASMGDHYALELFSNIHELMEGERNRFAIEYKSRTVNDESAWLVVIGERISDTGTFAFTLVTVSRAYDLTEHLKRIEKNYFSLVDNFSEAVFTVNKYAVITSVNKSFERFTGRTKSELLDRPFLEFLNQEDITTILTQLNLLLKGVETLKFEARFLERDGGIKYGNINARSVVENEAVTGAVFVVNDTTSLKSAELALKKSEEQYRSVVDAQRDSIIRFLSDFSITFVNESFCKLIEKDKTDILGSGLLSVIPFREQEKLFSLISSLNTHRNEVQDSLVVESASGGEHYLSIGITLISSEVNDLSEFQLIGTDFTELKKTQTALEQTEHMFRAIIEQSSDIVMLYNDEGEMFYASPSFMHILGYDEKEILGKQLIRDLVHEEDRKPTLKKLNTCLQISGSRIHFEARFLHNDGYYRTFDGTMLNRLEDANLQAFILSCHDVTEQRNAEQMRKSLEQELYRLSLVAKQITSAVVITDESYCITWVNEAFKHYFGYDISEIRGQNIYELVLKEEIKQSNIEKVLGNMSALNNIRSRHLLTTSMDTTFWNEILIDPMVDMWGKQIGFILVLNDITEAVQQERELIIAKEHAEELNRIKSNFLSNMSHELRTPLIGILGFADILREEIKDSELNSMAEQIHISGKRLLNTLNNLLDLAKIQNSEIMIHEEQVDIVLLARELIEIFSEYTKEKGLTLSLDINCVSLVTYTDKRILRDILANLLDNAVKFTERGGVELIISESNKNSNCCISISVKDTGVGIPEQSQKTIFEEFRQASEGNSRTFEGSGVGLTVTKRLLERLAGSIEVVSTVGVGSTFTIQIPKKDTPNKEETIKDNNNTIIANDTELSLKDSLKRVLFVDADFQIQQVTKLFLKNICEMHCVTSIEDGVASAESQWFSAVFIDSTLLSSQKAADSINTIREIERYKSVPIVALVNNSSNNDKELFFELGFSHTFSKPFDKRTIIEYVNALINDNETYY